MSESVPPSPETSDGVVTLESRIDIAKVQGLYDELRQVLESKRPIVIDGSQVAVVDTAALQTLLAFTVETKERGLSVEWREPSQALTQAANLIGIGPGLGL